ncbi:hypothetical protein G5C51_19220 [Streptomyces sp. A7024]|uniref:Type A2 lantipeptide n=1 Tax=Streptomyces coryli TaxID=1128680 RepID=A0A6G4U1A5_9ACTN|nr:hypothetical protein [Streptomyces coryli]NGN66015.1 hypothetical protein [Streptomyces coryli]
MRNDLETREIADTELDAISGGVITEATTLGTAVAGDVTNTVNGLQTVQAVKGVASSTVGGLAGATGLDQDAATISGLAG